MTTLEFLSLFVPASLILNLYPGPNNMFALANAASHDVGTAVRASLGRQLAFAGIVAALALGLGALILRSPSVFLGLELLCASFLLWLGLGMLRRAPAAGVIDGRRAASDTWSMFRDEFQVAFANPKPVIVLLPFLPYLITPGRVVSGAVLAAGCLFIALEGTAALFYALAGRRLAGVANTTKGRLWLNRAGAVSVILAGVLLAMAAIRS